MKNKKDLIEPVDSEVFYQLLQLVDKLVEEEDTKRIIALRCGKKIRNSSIRNFSKMLHGMMFEAMILKIQNNIENNKHEVEENETKE